MAACDAYQRIGLIGDPVEHSLSPAFQQPAFDALGLPIQYGLWPTPAAELPRRLDDIREGRALGANVTVPHKEVAFRYVDEVSPVAARAGAVNTISVRRGRLIGDNTDVHGFLVPLTERTFPFSSGHAVIIGAGGATRGVAVALLQAGIQQLTIVNRTRRRAEDLVAALNDSRLSVHDLDAIADIAPQITLLVNATALGWNDDEPPVNRYVFGMLAGDAIAYDLTYRETPFLHAAHSAGLTTIDGLPMLVHQGARSFEIWTGQTPPIELMWRTAVDARAQRGN